MRQIAALTMVSLILGLGISTLDQWTAPDIAQSREEVRREAIQRVLPSDAETIMVLQPAPSADQPIYRSSLAGKETGFVYGIATKEGYNGTIRAWLAISSEGIIRGIRTFTHQETPGIGHIVEAGEPFMSQFEGLSILGIDAVTGATITSRAMVDALIKARPMVNALLEREKGPNA
jgi:electron transport complex protein RnfG